jgi:hypothetical protein
MSQKYVVRPIQHGQHSATPQVHAEAGYAYRTRNVRATPGGVEKRWGYLVDRSLVDPAQGIYLYQKSDGSRYTLFLTPYDLAQREVGTSETFSYQTQTYATGTVSGITGAVVTGSGASWSGSGLAAGDKFIIAADQNVNIQPDANWATIKTVDNDNQITLTASYTGGTTSGAYKTRMVYSIPASERWSVCGVSGKFVFTNGNTNVQVYDGTGAATALDSTYAKQARYCIEYANRLVIADCYLSSTRYPYTVRWSKENDITDWTDLTAGSNDLVTSEDFITGLGKMGSDLIVYRRESLHIVNRTGVATSPLNFATQKRGIGCVAPWSIVEVISTNAFIGNDDFYRIDGTTPVSIGTPYIRDRFFNDVGRTERESAFGWHNPYLQEVLWIATTSTEGQKGFAWNYKFNEWYEYDFADFISAAGRGAI